MSEIYPLQYLAIPSSANSGRYFDESSCPLRNDFDRDRDRIIHSSAFRRLAYKTQVFVYHEGDHFRSRLTHSLEVAQIARSISRQLGLSEAMCEAIALAHDVGHPAFGHAGEDELDLLMKPYGGFDHNAQAFAQVTLLEDGYGHFDGLNLTFETLDGILKHNGAIADADPDSHLGQVLSRSKITGLIGRKARYPFPFLEAQIAAIADDIAYTAHDVDDGLRAGIIDLEGLAKTGFIREALDKIDQNFGELPHHKRVFELKRFLITQMVSDITTQIKERVASDGVKSWRDITQIEQSFARFSPEMAKKQKELFDFLYKSMYRHEDVMQMREKKVSLLRDIFAHLMESESHLEELWHGYLSHFNLEKNRSAFTNSESDYARMVCDFISGMTDRYAERMHKKISM